MIVLTLEKSVSSLDAAIRSSAIWLSEFLTVLVLSHGVLLQLYIYIASELDEHRMCSLKSEIDFLHVMQSRCDIHLSYPFACDNLLHKYPRINSNNTNT